jgi:hypothetical protein
MANESPIPTLAKAQEEEGANPIDPFFLLGLGLIVNFTPSIVKHEVYKRVIA